MARFLFAVPPLTGHVNPTVSVGGVLAERGHEVAWVGHPTKVGPLLPEGAHLIPLDDRLPPGMLAERRAKADSVRGLAAFKFLFEEFLVPLARAMEPQVSRAITDYRPDLVIVDHQVFGGAFAARKAQLPWASFVTTSASVTNALHELPKVQQWMHEQLAALEQESGLQPMPNPERSPYLVTVFSTGALVGDVRDFEPHYAFVGPSIVQRPPVPFPWQELDPNKSKVLVSLGTVNVSRGKRFFGAVCEALADSDLQVILVAGQDAVPDPPANVIRRNYVPQLDLLPHMDVVISHGGHNTVCESLANGLPLLVTPIKDDQPVVARQVVEAGAGLRLRFRRAGAKEIRACIDRLLNEPHFGEAAKHIGDSFRAAGGAERASTQLEELAKTRQAYDRNADNWGAPT